MRPEWYQCTSCQHGFHETDAAHDSEYIPEARRKLHFLRCPVCMSDQIERAYKCAKCGEPRHQFEEGTDYCLECWPEVAERDDDHGEICRHP